MIEAIERIRNVLGDMSLIEFEADWQRPKSEVMPPKTAFNTTLQVKDFGGIDQGFNVPTETVAGDPVPSPKKSRFVGRLNCV